MTTSRRTPTTITTGNVKPIPAGDIAYFLGRQKNKIYDAVFHRFMEMSDNDEISRAIIAKKLDKDPAQITRWLSGPGNWTLETMGMLLLAMDAEIDPVVSTIGERVRSNYCHPLYEENEYVPLVPPASKLPSPRVDIKIVSHAN